MRPGLLPGVPAPVRAHPVGRLLTEAVAGRFPAADGRWTMLPPWGAGVEAVLAFTGHAVLALDPQHGVTLAELADLGVDGYGGAHDPRVMRRLAGPGGWVDALDAVLVAVAGGPLLGLPTGGDALVPRPDLADHPRVAFARRVRTDVQVYGAAAPADRSLVTLGRGLGGLLELGIEVDPARAGRGRGLAMLRWVLAGLPPGTPVAAACAPGNARALRAFLAAGFAPVGSVQLFRRERA